MQPRRAMNCLLPTDADAACPLSYSQGRRETTSILPAGQLKGKIGLKQMGLVPNLFIFFVVSLPGSFGLFENYSGVILSDLDRDSAF